MGTGVSTLVLQGVLIVQEQASSSGLWMPPCGSGSALHYTPLPSQPCCVTVRILLLLLLLLLLPLLLL
jgi:hypothetical protein